MLAPLIIEDHDDGVDADVEYVVMLDDWLDGIGTTPDDELSALTNMNMADMGSMTMSTSPLLGGDAGDVTYTFSPAPRQGD